MEFSAKVTGLAAKDTSEGNRIELKLSAQFDTALFAQLGECFSDRVHVVINHPQGTLKFGEGEGEGELIEEVFGEGEAETDEELFEQTVDEYEEADEEAYHDEIREEIEKGKRDLSEDPAGEPSGT